MLSRDATTVDSAFDASRITCSVMLLVPGALPSLRRLIETCMSSVVNRVLKACLGVDGVISDRSHRIVGSPVARNKRSACSAGSLVNCPSGLRRGGRLRDPGGSWCI